VASLFPGESEADRNRPEIYQPVIAVKPPPQRITLGYPVIAAAREVWVLASGAGKAKALEESLKPDGQTPLARVIQSRRQTAIPLHPLARRRPPPPEWSLLRRFLQPLVAQCHTKAAKFSPAAADEEGRSLHSSRASSDCPGSAFDGLLA
jgi:hypothetical protein